jgi:hypothetical protein
MTEPNDLVKPIPQAMPLILTDARECDAMAIDAPWVQQVTTTATGWES